MRGGIILSLLFFIMGLIVLIVFISPINEILDLAQQSDSLNCKGFIYDSDVNHILSYDNSTHGGQSGNPTACLALKLYIPYILMVFLIGGLAAVLGGRGDEIIMGDGGE